ncbi:MAG: DUF4394 domain-containing protein [Steroidobacter sp.]
MRLMKLGSAAVLICAVFTLAGCGDNGNDESRMPRIQAPNSLDPASLGLPYSTTFMASGGNITWSVSQGTLPPGLTLDTMSGTYSGTPTSIGSFSFTVRAVNDFGSDTRAYSQDVNLPSSDTNALLSNNRLAAFPMSFPAGFETPVPVTGVLTGDVLVSIDRRPQNGFLYGLGYNATAGTVQLYNISSSTAFATAIGTPGTFVDATGTQQRIGVDAQTIFGMDFNPTVDRVRVVNSAGQNFRINPNNGALVDGDATSAGTQMDGGINGPTMSLQETAYTNSSPSVTVTTQYGVDQVIDALCIQNPPNSGTQTMCQPLSVPLETVQGFDIPPSVTVTTSNSVATGSGVAIVRASGRTQDEVVMVNLTSGAVTTAGPISTTGVIGIALQQPTAVPIVALSADASQLIRFLSSTPGTTATATIAGVNSGETLVGIDFRPQTGQLYSFGVNPSTDTGTVYILDPQSGAATPVGTVGQVAYVDGTGAPVDLPLVSAGYGFDFNPTVDRIRVVTGSGLNFRLNPNDGTAVDGNLNNTASPPAGINTDGNINGGPNGSSGVTAAAYTNSFGQSLTGGVTTQYVLDPASNTLFIQNPPNAGTLTQGQAITVSGNALDFTEASGFDIPANIRVTMSATPATGLGYAALTVGSTTRLYSIELSSGRALNLGNLPNGVSGLAVGQSTVR